MWSAAKLYLHYREWCVVLDISELLTSPTVDDQQVGHINQVGHLSKTPLSLLEIHEIGPVDTFESKQQNYDQIWHMWPPYQKWSGLSHVSWLSQSHVMDCKSWTVSHGL